MKTLFKLLAAVAALVLVGLVVKKLLEEKSAPVPPPVEEKAPPPADKSLDESELGGALDPELLKILVCPLDRGPLKLSEDGKWLINPRNGYRYPIRRGIPVMLVEEGRKYQDTSLIEAAAA
ncbi:MAG: Trm112 family protein [Caldilineales bacterium]|nr:Trm112 family protein [Caldilineales bacterium]MDW8316482.1 Trm112 family protein [Anaerolineae bacterium]